MATIQKRKNSYRVEIRRGGKSLSASFDTKQEAADWSIRAEASILDGKTGEDLSVPVDPNAFTGVDMLIKCRNEVSPTKRGVQWEQVRLDKLIRDYRIFRRPACSITGPDMARWRDARLTEVSASSVNRELCLISSVFSKALREWEIGVTANPIANIERPRKARPRHQRVNETDRLRLERELGWDGASAPVSSSQWAAFAFKLAVLTAMRKGEILSLD